jgi:hypothetical protein
LSSNPYDSPREELGDYAGRGKGGTGNRLNPDGVFNHDPDAASLPSLAFDLISLPL